VKTDGNTEIFQIGSSINKNSYSKIIKLKKKSKALITNNMGMEHIDFKKEKISTKKTILGKIYKINWG